MLFHGCTVLTTVKNKINKVALVKATKHEANPATHEGHVGNQNHGLA